MIVRAPFLVAALAIAASAFLLPVQAEAQRRAVVRRPVVVRPAVVVRARPTVFVGGFYYPNFYRPSLYYGYGSYYGGYYAGYYGGYYGGIGWPYYYPGPPYYSGRYDLGGSVRTQVAPRETEVFIDGYFAGTVDDFDGVFQRLNIESGDHDIEFYLPGHRSFRQRVYLQPGRTFHIRHTMEPLGPGEPVPARPAGAPLPPPGTRDPYAAVPSRDPRHAGPDSRVPAPTAQGFGQLSLRVQPADANVLIDGERWEGGLENERLVVQLGTGLHRIEIRRDGYRNYFTDVAIANGQTRALNVALTKE